MTHVHTASRGWSQDLDSGNLASECMLVTSVPKLAKQTAFPNVKKNPGLQAAGGVPWTKAEVFPKAGSCS